MAMQKGAADQGRRQGMPRARADLRSWAVALLGVAMALAAPSKTQAAPNQLLFEGVLRSAGGGPAADGAYDVQVALYADAQAQQPVWSESIAGVNVASGGFTLALGATKVLSDSALASATVVGIRVGADPELPRQALFAVAFARLAGTASDLACSGCVASSEISFDSDIDLAGNSIKAKNATFVGDLSAKTITAQSFLGDGSKLSGTWKATGSCKTGEAVVGIASDGTLQCKAVDGGAGGKLATVTGGLLTNEFTFVGTTSSLPLAIPDNTGAEAAVLSTITEAGIIESISVHVVLGNSDLSKVRVVLLPPDDKVKGITLCDPCGASNAKQLDLTVPSPQVQTDGDLTAYVGKSGKGIWTLKVLDSSFCILQLPGNNQICDLNKGTDGAVATFDVTLKVLAGGAVAVPGMLVPGMLQLPTDPKPLPTCEAKVKGLAFVDTLKGQLLVCDGADWRTADFANACGNGIVSGAEQCDDGNNIATDGCTNACKKAVCGDKVVHAGVEVCDDGNTTDNDGCSSSCKSEIVQVPECLNPTINTDATRKASYAAAGGCDSSMGNLWYRFTGDAGTKLAMTAPPVSHCGTSATGWMQGALPAVADGAVSRTVCFHWSGNTCNWSAGIQVRNCGQFYVFKLPNAPSCSLRYCTED